MLDSSSVATTLSSPYPGLRPFQAEEAGIFFGREEQIDHMLTRLETHRFMAVVGTSGCGKSSLVRAGLIPALQQGLLCGAYPNWRMAVMRPGDAPFRCLATALLEPKALRERGDDPRAAAFLEATLRRGPLGLWEAIRETHLQTAQTNVLLVVDQFEEIFRYRQQIANVNDADAFVNLLVASAHPPKGNKTQQDPPLFIVLTMRSDFIGDCALFIGLPELISETDFLTPRMTRSQYQEAIVEPARVFGWDLEPALVNRLLNDLGDTPDQLPVFQHALMRMWTWASADMARPAKVLTMGDYETVGGLAKALSWHADEALQGLTPRQQELAQSLFRCLSERSASKRDTRRPVKLQDVADVAGVAHNELIRVVNAFRRADRSFIMPPETTPLTAETVLDISHESLISHWSLLNQWADKEAESAAIYLRLDDAAHRFKVGEGELWRGVELRAALEWHQKEHPNTYWAARYTHHEDDFKLAVAFLDNSKRNENRERLQHYILPIIIVMLILFSTLSIYALQQRDAARQAAGRARIAYLALESQNSRDTAPDLGLLLALEAVRLGNDPKMGYVERDTAEQALRWALAAAGSQPLSGHQSPVFNMAVSPDDRLLASIGWDRTVRLWNLMANPPVQCRILRGHKDGIAGVAFSPDNHWLATAGKDGTVGLWALRRLCDPTHPGTEPNPENEPDRRLVLPGQDVKEAFTVVAFSPTEGGHILAAGDKQGAINLWDMTHHEAMPQPLENKHKDEITALEFSPDGRLLASASLDKTVNIWDVPVTPNSVAPTWRRNFTGHDKRVTALAFSPYGHWLASADADGTIYLWDPTNISVYSIPFKGHEDAVTDLAFRQDGECGIRLMSVDTADSLVNEGRNLVIVALVGTTLHIRIFDANGNRVVDKAENDLKSGEALATLKKQLHTLPDESSLSLEQKQKIIRDATSSAGYTRDGHTLISASRDGTIRLWDTAAEPPPAPPPKPRIFLRQDSLSAMVLAKDEHRLFSASRGERILRVWNLDKPTTLEPLQLWDHERSVVTVAFTPDGLHLISADKGGGTRIWNLTKPFPVDVGGAGPQSQGSGAQPQEGGGARTETAFRSTISPNGRILATADENSDKDYSVRLHNLTNPTAGPQLLPAQAFITALAFGSDGQTLAGADKNRQVFLWNLTDPQAAPHILSGHETPATALAFSPEGRMLASADDSGQVLLWELNNLRAGPRRFKPHSTSITALAFSPDGHTLVSASRDNTMRLLNRDNGQEIHIFTSHEGTVMTLAFSPDGKTLASGSTDNIVRLWDLEHPKRDARVLRGHQGPVLSLAFSPDGRLLASGATDHAVFIWHTRSKELSELACKSIQRNLSPKEWEKYFKDEKYHEACPRDRL